MMHKLKGDASTRRVWLSDKELTLALSQKYWNHSPDGFNWGYGGSGGAQLALAIMFELTNKPDNYQSFKWKIIASLPIGKDFEITFDENDLHSH